jgi:MGT family glycosyltransferase
MQPGAFCGAELRSVPVAALVHTLYAALLDNGAPGPISMAASTETVNDARRTLGLAPIDRLADLLDGAARVLITCPRELDVPLDDLPSNVCYVGAELETVEPSDEWHAPGDPDLPLICISLGTTPMGEAPVLQTLFTALGELPVRVVATIGGHLDPGAFAVPANCTVSGYVKHSLIMPHAAVVITHAGLGTVLNALAHGVPLLCIPLGRDQPQNADAVDRSGAGLTVEATASVDEIREAVQELLASEWLREGASRMASIIQTSALERRGAREVEMIAQTGPHPSGPLSLDQS